MAGGELHGPDVEVAGATQDSRELVEGQLFVPVVAERDGHDFIPAALESGAAAYLSNGPTPGGTAIVVDDTVAALQAIGRHGRNRLGESWVVGITGSVGKTSTKDLVAAIFATAGPTHASARSFNNELGVPLTILNAPDDVASLVVEMGTRGPGQIATLAAIAAPSIGIVTTVGAAHTSEFGSVEAVIEAKGELVESLPLNGFAVLNAEVPGVLAMASRTSAEVITFGRDEGDVHATSVVRNADLTSNFDLQTPWGSASVTLGARGDHNVVNACAAAAAALAAGLSLTNVVTGLARPDLSPWRMELLRTPTGTLVLNDTYNANPLSVEAALRSLVELDASAHVAVLGVMAELGEESDAEHERMAALAAELGVRLISVDAPYGGDDQVPNAFDAATIVLGLGPDDAVLVKGSRVAELERLVEVLGATPVAGP